MYIKIGEVQTLSVDDWSVTPDDRQQMIEVIGGVVVQDFGHVSAGDKITCKISVRQDDARKLFNYWHNRLLVDVEDETGAIWESRRILIKSYSYRPFFPTVYDVEVEFWGI